MSIVIKNKADLSKTEQKLYLSGQINIFLKTRNPVVSSATPNGLEDWGGMTKMDDCKIIP